MALTGAQRAQVRMYLGWSARFHSTDSRLEQAMDALAGTPEDESLIVAELGRLTAIDTEISDTSTTGKVTSLGKIELRAAYRLSVLRARGRQAAARIASILGVRILSDAFSGGGPAAFAGPYGPED